MDRTKSQSNGKAIKIVGAALRKMGDDIVRKTEDHRRRQNNASLSFSSKNIINNKLSYNRKY